MITYQDGMPDFLNGGLHGTFHSSYPILFEGEISTLMTVNIITIKRSI